MKFNAEFVASYPKLVLCPTGELPEVAFIGRSNVGKSSLINAITDRKQLAKTSSTPGKTQLLNFFIVNKAFHLVDMPGFGYAKVAKDDRKDWAKLTEDYFLNRKQLKAVALLIDSRHPLLENDVAVVEWFSEKNIPFFIVMTKSDKPKQQDLARHERLLKEHVFTAMKIFRTSSEKGTGINQLRSYIGELVSTKSVEI